MKRLTTMPLDDDRELDQLLARNRLSGAEYDRIERRVLAQVVPKRRSRAAWALAPLFAAASAFSVWALVGRAPEADRGPAPPVAAEFRAKGPAQIALATVHVGCAGGSPHVCALGDTLMFSVGPSSEVGYLVAYAERIDEPSRPPIWYFPAASGEALRVEPAAATRVLPQGIRFAKPHEPGRYRVRAWLAPAPLDRRQALGGVPATAHEVVLEIVDQR